MFTEWIELAMLYVPCAYEMRLAVVWLPRPQTYSAEGQSLIKIQNARSIHHGRCDRDRRYTARSMDANLQLNKAKPTCVFQAAIVIVCQVLGLQCAMFAPKAEVLID